jgi:hypothetical protein
LFIFPRSVCQSFFHVPDVERKPLKLKFLEKMAVTQLPNVVVAVSKKSFQSNQLKAKLTFTAC